MNGLTTGPNAAIAAAEVSPPVQTSAVPQQANPTPAATTETQPEDMQASEVPSQAVQGPLPETMLAEAQPQGQKQMLGQRIYDQVEPMYPDLATKITGMLLERTNDELLDMLEKRESLEEWVEEAVTVLHQAKLPSSEDKAAPESSPADADVKAE